MNLTLCSCGSAEHQILTEYDEEYNQLYVQVHLSNYKNIFQRIWVAIKYVFGYKCRYGEWDSIIIDSSNYHTLKKELSKIKGEGKKTNSGGEENYLDD